MGIKICCLYLCYSLGNSLLVVHPFLARKGGLVEGNLRVSISSAAATFPARWAAKKNPVRNLYRHALKNSLDWAIHCQTLHLDFI